MSKVTECIGRFLACETRGILGGFLGGVVGSAIAFAAINYFGHPLKVEATDAVSIANTYIVYTTFVIAAVGAFLAIAGMIFTQHLSIEKNAHVENAFKILLVHLNTDEEKAVKFAMELMKNPEVVQSVSEAINGKLDQIVSQRRAHADQREAQAKTERSALQDLIK